MDPNPQTLQLLSECFLGTMSPLPEPRSRAESFLADAAGKPNFALALLCLVAESSVDEHIRLAAVIAFKNHLKSRWAQVVSADGIASSTIDDSEKEQIKAQIIPLMVRSSPKIQPQLSEVFSVIGKHDFPNKWPSLLSEMVARLDASSQGNDYPTVNGVLVAINSLFDKFRYGYRSEGLLLDLKFCLDNFARPLLLLFQGTAGLLDKAANPAALKLYLDSQRLCCEIFYSLNFQDLPEFFEDHMSEWMIEFKKYLTVKYPALEDGGNDQGMAVVDELRAAVCENISLYMEKEEEQFEMYVSGFVEAVWGLVRVASSYPSREKLTVTAMKFLCKVSTSAHHHPLFGRDNVLQQIVEGVIIPNVMLRNEEGELFDMNPVEFISRDLEGSDMETRRRVACDLLKGIALHYKENVARIIQGEIQRCLEYFGANAVANWKYKDCAVYLVVSLSTKKAGGGGAGVSFSTTDLVNVDNFFTLVIVPELQCRDVNAFPILKADALKFFTVFRNQIPKPIALAVLPDVVRFLHSESTVVVSYAATCIEKLLLVKDDNSRPRYTPADISPYMQPLLNSLVSALEQDSAGNHYVLKCLRVIGILAEIPLDVVLPCLRRLTKVLEKIFEHRKNQLFMSQVFNHYLFDSIAAFVRGATAAQTVPCVISALEAELFPPIQVILRNGICEFFPYAFQLLAQLLEFTPDLNRYLPVFKILLMPDSWTKSCNVSTLVYLLQAFLRKLPQEMMVQQGKLVKVLEIFSVLIVVPSSDEPGFYVLNTVIENVCFDVIQPLLRDIWLVLFKRLSGKPTGKFVKNLLIFMSLFLVKYGADKLVASINAIEDGLFYYMLEQLWIPSLEKIFGFIELKLTSVASTKLICESPELWESGLAVKLLNSTLSLVTRPKHERAMQEDELEILDFDETTRGNTATYARLCSVGKKNEDPLKETKDPKQFLVVSLAKLCAASPGKYVPIITNNIDQPNRAALAQLCKAYDVRLD
ncbi:OLC1v1009814C1 [Oldenlandia corymbosa var. corymbosa]|uniref:OLC1v1009814C1 n=1 Tax=Oldenlandia corymbosa var. corymbosa TaxID=529605 RepID=A0AAV1DS94_OLDCO|nr:OLC1v1009814C1 [Oldenlandia corymbosa var. corymbosa]